MIEIKRGTSADMLALWQGENAEFADKYCRNIDSGEQEIWMAWDTETAAWVGELHLALRHKEVECRRGGNGYESAEYVPKLGV